MTLALTAGVPLELVQRVTGRRTAEVVMKHFRAARLSLVRPVAEEPVEAEEAAEPEVVGGQAKEE